MIRFRIVKRDEREKNIRGKELISEHINIRRLNYFRSRTKFFTKRYEQKQGEG